MDDDDPRFEPLLSKLKALIDQTTLEREQQSNALMAAAETLKGVDITEIIRGARRIRSDHFSADLFGEPAWDLLLELHIAYHRQQAVSVSSAVTFGETSPSTGARWLGILERQGLVERRDDPADQRRQFVSLTEVAVARLDRYMAAFATWVATKAKLTKL